MFWWGGENGGGGGGTVGIKMGGYKRALEKQKPEKMIFISVSNLNYLQLWF